MLNETTNQPLYTALPGCIYPVSRGYFLQSGSDFHPWVRHVRTCESLSSTITVPAGLGLITDVNLLLYGLYHTWPGDIDILLVGPTGIAVLVWSDVGASDDVFGIDVVIDDEAGSSGPCDTALSSGTFQPTDCSDLFGDDVFDPPAPGGPYASTLAAFYGTDPAGTWSLFFMDDAFGDAGQLANGWALDITTTDSVVIPEPATALMLFGGLAILVGLRRRYSH